MGKGTGLGLSQVQGFIAQSGGAVEVESFEGKGARVHIFLPASSGDGEQAARAADAEIVLIVEDEVELGKLAGSLFETLGYQVMLAHNGHDALELLADHPSIDVLFTDVMMPGMTGIELARTAIQLVPKLKIIIASAYPMPALKPHGDIDDFSFVGKPYRLSEIVRKLR